MTSFAPRIRPPFGAAGFVLAWAVGASAFVPAFAGTKPPQADVVLTQTRNEVSIVATFDVPAQRDAVWRVLTDYEHLASFMHGIKRSEWQKTPSGERLLFQEAVGRFAFFSRTLRLRLFVQEEPLGQITFEDRSGESFSAYVGAWHLEPQGEGTRVTYNLVATPKVSAPSIVVTHVLRSQTSTLINDLTSEVARRIAHRQASTLP